MANPGEGVNLGSGGSIRFDRLIAQANLLAFSGTLTIDTNLGIMEHSDGTRHYGIIEDHIYRHSDGTTWPYSVCHFAFEEIQLGGSLVINLQGQNGLLLEARSGDFILGTDIRADGGHSSIADNSGGTAILGGYDGAPAGQMAGIGPASLHKPPSKGMEQDMADMDQAVQARLGILPCLAYLEEVLVAHPAVMDQEPVVAPYT